MADAHDAWAPPFYAVAGEPWGPLFRFHSWTGCRRGEAVRATAVVRGVRHLDDGPQQPVARDESAGFAIRMPIGSVTTPDPARSQSDGPLAIDVHVTLAREDQPGADEQTLVLAPGS